MNILKDVKIVDLGLFFEKEKLLAISDVHIGYEEAMNKQGLLVPRVQFKEIMIKLEKLLRLVRPNTVLINGDLKHEFGTISEQEWRDTLKFLDLISKYAKEIILIKGNHDMVLGPIAKKRNVSVLKDYSVGGVLFTHGDVINKKKSKVIVIGHEHPAITLTKGIRHEKFKCFLKGKYKGAILIAMPSFFLITEGTDVQQEELLSPYLHQNLKNFEVFISAGGDVFDFGKIKNLG